MDALNAAALWLTVSGIVLTWVALLLYYLGWPHTPLRLTRSSQNPVLAPRPENWWESEAVFNPAAFVHGGRVHLFYRALGRDGISRIGYASSKDGTRFDERPAYPVYDPGDESLARARESRAGTKLSYTTLTYDSANYGSGGGWGGSEDPRAVIFDGQVYLTFTAFEGWNNERIALAKLSVGDFNQKRWHWSKSAYLSAPGEVQKNWLLFPEKIQGKYAVLHNIDPTIEIAYVDDLEAMQKNGYIESEFHRSDTPGRWDVRVRGAGTPPIKTPQGWLLLYHGYNPKEGAGYNVGAMLLDLKDPSKILYRSIAPILTPQEWYENDWKPGVVYASGAVIFNGDLLVYYGGGDKYVGAAKVNLKEFLAKLIAEQPVVLTPVRVQ